MQGPVKGESEGTVLQQPPGCVTQGRGLCASLTLLLASGTLPVPRASSGRKKPWNRAIIIFFLKDLVQRRTGLCLLLLVNYLGCWLPPSPPLGFCILLSHDPIVALHPLTLPDTQGCTLLTEFPALMHFIFPFPVQPLEKLLLSSVTTFASLDILFSFICFLLLYVFSCLLVGSITSQEGARPFYHAHVSNWDLPGSMGHCVCLRKE